MATAKAQFIPTKTVKLTREDFQTVVSMYFESDGWHLIGLEDLVKGEGDAQIDEGAEILGLITEAAGDAAGDIDWTGILKCRVIDGVVTAIYTPGIMGAEDRLLFVSGDNRFPIHYEASTDVFLLGNMTGRLSEREYLRADGSKGRAVSIMFAPNNKDLKVIYDVPLVFQQFEKIADKLPEGAEISRELVDWMLGEEWVELPEEKGSGVKLLSSILLPTLSGGMGDVLKLPTLGKGVFKLVDWIKMPQQPAKKDEKQLPASYKLFLTDMNDNPLPNAYYSNQGIRRQLEAMSSTFRQDLEKGRELQLRTGEPFKVGQNDAIQAVIQLLPPNAGAIGMKSAAVQSPQLPQGQTKDAAEFMRSAEAVEVTATPIGETTKTDIDYDPVPF